MAKETKKILVTVKTYPIVSSTFNTAVCTAGITEGGEWIRIFPIPYDLVKYSRIKKYDWIVFTGEKAKEKMARKESYELGREGYKTIKVVGGLPVIGKEARENWKKRKEIVLKTLFNSMEELELLKKTKKVSLGTIKPKEVTNFYWVKNERCAPWEKDLLNRTQKTLYGDYTRDVDKPQWVFRYEFKCDDPGCKGHDMMCEDWELLESYRSWTKVYGKNEALVRIKDKFFKDFFKNSRDSYFFVGTESKWNKFLIIGIFYPPKGI